VTHGDVRFADFLKRRVAGACASALAAFSKGSRRSTQSAGPLAEKPAPRYTPTKIWSDSRQSEGPESRNVATVIAPTHDRSRCAEHGGIVGMLSVVCPPHRG
jgi:hypothetical protein